MKLKIRSLILVLIVGTTAPHVFGQDPLNVIRTEKIWDAGGHNAFTDLIRFDEKFFCTFREADGHVKGDGKIRVITSEDGWEWTSAALLAEESIDLRDPKISITPQGELMLLVGGSDYEDGKLVGRRTRVYFSKDGTNWEGPTPVCENWDWLWRVTWHKGTGWGVAYNSRPEGDSEEWKLKLFKTSDGKDYELVKELKVDGRPNETTLRFDARGQMIALIRREGGDKNGWIGTANAPFSEWSFGAIQRRLGGPNFIILEDGRMVASTRQYGESTNTIVGIMSSEGIAADVTLPSGGDTSYAGMLWHDEKLWVSYYASHEGKTSIYLAAIDVAE